MSKAPVICFGQQPCGIFPRRFLFAKIVTARRLQAEIGGEIVFFFHDSDHDPRETRTILRHRKTNDPFEINFTFANKLQRKYSPLYLKRVLPDWHAKTALQLPAYADKPWVEAFMTVPLTNVADFCLEMYRRMGLLDGMRVIRSGDAGFRRAACDVPDFYVDVPYQGEIVRARHVDRELKLHEGGDSYRSLPPTAFTRENISPARDTRLRWMQSVVRCTHYVAGAGEQHYLRREEAPEITYVPRDTIDRSDEAYTDFQPDRAPLLAFGAHPDDIEFGCGGVVAMETRAGRAAHFVVCSRGESGTHGTPEQRVAEARHSAELLGATVEFIDLDGDAHLELRAAHAIKLAEAIRRLRPAIVLAPSLVDNQHPDHPRLGFLVRDAARLARYGGVAELRGQPPHAIDQLLFYAVTADSEPPDVAPVLIDVSDPDVIAAWVAAMEAHVTQAATRNYAELQMARARLNGLRAGVGHAIALFPSDPLVVSSLAQIGRGARSF